MSGYNLQSTGNWNLVNKIIYEIKTSNFGRMKHNDIDDWHIVLFHQFDKRTILIAISIIQQEYNENGLLNFEYFYFLNII